MSEDSTNPQKHFSLGNENFRDILLGNKRSREEENFDFKTSDPIPIDRISANSKVNFSKLQSYEKRQRLNNLRQYGIELSYRLMWLKQNKSDFVVLNKHLQENIEGLEGINILQFLEIVKSLSSIDKVDLTDHRNILDGLIEIINKNRAEINSIRFAKILSLLINLQQVDFLHAGRRVLIKFDDAEYVITEKEMHYYGEFTQSPICMRVLLGLRPWFCQQTVENVKVNQELSNAANWDLLKKKSKGEEKDL